MSRYNNVPRTWVPHPTNGWVQVAFRRPTFWRQQVYSEYQARESDDMVLLAHQSYGDSSRYWGIAEMNPSIACPDDLAPGDLIRIPAPPR